jgi:iron-sulfur cluster repair protein YtfE (RIC family)
MSKSVVELVRQHRQCDDELNRCEGALLKADLTLAARHFSLFSEELDAHFSLEENTLFPAFEQATGMMNGPTAVMRSEHAEIRHLRDEVAVAIDTSEPGQALAVIDTLNVLLQQHNVKEENMLYPMCAGQIAHLDSVLGRGSA